MYQLVVVACCKNEGLYIKEWIEYHSLIGVEHFYIYDAATDNTRDILEPYVKNGTVTYIEWKVYPAQVPAYHNFVFQRRGMSANWAAFIDLDEYIVLKDSDSLTGFLKDYDRVDIAGLAIGWSIFGSSGHVTRPEGLIIENYTKCVDYTLNKERFTKVIVRPNKIAYVDDPHFLKSKSNCRIVREDHVPLNFGDHHHRLTTDFPVQRVQLNHYFCKSFSDFQGKIARRGPDGGGRFFEEFANCNATANAVEDTVIQKYIPELRRRMYDTTKGLSIL